MPKKAGLKQKLDKLQKFIDGLTELDKQNFGALLSLGAEAIDRLPDSTYKEMAILSFAIKSLKKE